MSRPSTPKIERFVVRALRVPMREPHRTASGVVAESPLVLTDIVTRRRDDRPQHDVHLHTGGAAADRRADSQLRSADQGRRAGARSRSSRSSRAASACSARRASSAWRSRRIDMALWDALARLHGVALVRLLGGAAKAAACLWRGRLRRRERIRARSRRTGRSAASRASRPRSATRPSPRTSPSSAPCGRPSAPTSRSWWITTRA